MGCGAGEVPGPVAAWDEPDVNSPTLPVSFPVSGSGYVNQFWLPNQ